MSSIAAEYIWLGAKGELRGKTKVLTLEEAGSPPDWSFDGSSTEQATGGSSDVMLKPVRMCPNPMGGILVLCDTWIAESMPHPTNKRPQLLKLSGELAEHKCLFGIEQEYVMLQSGRPIGFPPRGYPPPQGPYYCAVGNGLVQGRDLAMAHLEMCLKAGLSICGINAEVMIGQWEYQIGPLGPLEVCDQLWLSRYLLSLLGEQAGVSICLKAKPILGDWNGSGAHTNISTEIMREDGGFNACVDAAKAFKDDFCQNGFPKVYGKDYKERLTGSHETCSWEHFRFGVGDRTASVRIPNHVAMSDKGYIEDRRPCADINPYESVAHQMEVICGGK